jgi:hypothetical protein
MTQSLWVTAVLATLWIQEWGMMATPRLAPPALLHEGDVGRRRVHLVAFSNKIIWESCVSMETALLAGWTYNLVTKFTATNASRSGANGEKTLKLYAFKDFLASRRVRDQDIILFADAFDVVFQGSAAAFASSVVGNRRRVAWDVRTTMVFNAEDFCHPFICCSASYRCPLTQGAEYLKRPNVNNTPHACELQTARARATAGTSKSTVLHTVEKGVKRPIVFLNSGVSVGAASIYRAFIDRALAMVATLPPLCHDDQGIMAWMYAKDDTSVTLDFASAVLATSQVHVLKDYAFNNVTGMWQHRNGASPFLIHFAGSRRAYVAYKKSVYNWHKRRLGGTAAIRAFLRNQTISVDGEPRPFHSVCPEEQPSLWNNFVSGVDMVLKRSGITKVRPPPEECPPEFCPRFFRRRRR